MKSIQVLKLDVDNITKEALLVGDVVRRVIIPLNVDVIMKLQRDKEFREAVERHRSNVCLCMDSQVIRLLWSGLFRQKFRDKISGSDFLPAYYEYHANNPEVTIFLLGAKGGVAGKAMEMINRKVGRRIVVGAISPSMGFERYAGECDEILETINRSGATTVVVGVGAPKQEKWIFSYMDRMPNVKLFIAAGAAIDFEAGNIKRAPRWVSQIGLEWLFRMIIEPKRLAKRYLIDDLPFLWLALKQRIQMVLPNAARELKDGSQS